MGQRKLEFQIKASIFDELVKIQNKLPAQAQNVPEGGSRYDLPAGLALLGMKDNSVDTVIPLRMTGGCWDAPNIGGKDMYDGIEKLMELGRICSGMALVRHPRWATGHNVNEGSMPDVLRGQLHGLRKNFEDITKTAWVVLHNSHFRLYRPTKGKDGRIGCKEITIEKLFSEEDKKIAILMNKIERDKELRKAKALELIARRKQVAMQRAEVKKRAEEEKKLREAAQKDAEEKAELARKIKEDRAKRERKRIDLINQKLKEGKDEIIDACKGMVYMRQKNGEYILWQTGS